MADSSPTAEPDPHFIGWYPIPQAFARFLLPIATALLGGVVVAAGVFALKQRAPGTGQWEDESTTTYEGVVIAEPYAMIRVPAGDLSAPPKTVFLVEEGKYGAKSRAQSLDGRPVRVSGTLLHRDGRRLLELLPGDDGLREIEWPPERVARLWPLTPTALGPVTMLGEIVDTKCYLGAMKPGDGRTHKGCAVLCLRGGIPPMLVIRGADDQPAYHLLTNAQGGPLDPKAFEFVGEPVEVSGISERWGEVSVLKVDADGIRRVR